MWLVAGCDKTMTFELLGKMKTEVCPFRHQFDWKGGKLDESGPKY